MHIFKDIWTVRVQTQVHVLITDAGAAQRE